MFYIPRNLEGALPFLVKSNRMDKHINKFYWFIHNLYCKRVKDKTKDSNHFYNLNSILLHNLLGRDYAKKIITILQENQIVECDNNYIVGEKSKGYKLSEYYLNSDFISIEPNLDRFYIKILEYKNKPKQFNKPIQFIYDSLLNVSFDNNLEKTINNVKEEYWNNDFRKSTDLLSIRKIQNKEFFINVDEFAGRCYHNITNIRSDFRKNINLNSEKTKSIDISNSQPLFLALSLNKKFPNLKDLQFFLDLCLQGILYDFLRIGNMNRETSKKRFFIEILYDKEIYINPFTENFKSNFPNVYKIISAIKKKDYKSISFLLQKQEKEFIIEKIIGENLKQKKYAITIHDSILCKEKDIDFYYNAIKKSIDCNLKIN